MAEKQMVNGTTTRKTRDKSKGFLIFVTVLLLCVIFLGSGYVYYYVYLRQDQILIGTTCVTEACLKASLDLLTSVDTSVDFCQDFYQFTCGKYLGRNKVQLLDFEETTEAKLNSLISTPIAGDEWTPLLLQKQFYQSCRDVESIDSNKNVYIYDLTGELGGWPVLEKGKWQTEEFDLTTFLIKCADLGVPFEWLFGISYKKLADSNDTFVTIIEPTGVEELKIEMKVAAYRNLIAETMVQFGGSRLVADYEAKKMLQLEYGLNKVWKHYNPDEDQPIEETELMNIINHINLPFVIRNITGGFLEPTNDTIVLGNLDILKNLNLLLAGTSKWTLANFLIWKIIQNRGIYLASPLRENFGNFSNLFNQEYSVSTREDVCLKDAKKRFPLVANIAYKIMYLTEERVEDIREMIGNIKESFLLHLDNTEWIEEDVKNKMRNKIENMRETINILEENGQLLFELLDSYKSGIDYGSMDIYEKLKMANALNLETRLYMLNNTLEPIETLASSLPSRIEYKEEYNEIVLPTPYLEDHFYNDERPDYINYGILGTALAKEISKSLGIDSATGEVPSNETLWENESYYRLISRTACLKDQYLSVYEDHNDEILAENFVNSISVDFAYESYLNWVKKNYRGQRLSNVNYEPDELFWIFYEMQFCNEHTNLENHVPLTFKALNPLRNSRYFGKVFGCSLRSAMNPRKKCIIF